MMAKKIKELLMITIDRATGLYLATLETEGKSPRYIDWLSTAFRNYIPIFAE